MTFSPEMLKELLSTFQCELEESAISLINGLVELEKAGDDKKTRTENIEIIFRTAHNLKGAARGLGISQIGDIAHLIESIFSNLKTAEGEVPAATIDICVDAVDKMQSAMRAYLNKTDPDFDLQSLLSGMQACVGVADVKNHVATPVAVKPDIQSDVVPVKTMNLAKDPKTISGDSIRVPLKVIDRLSELSEEVQASKIEMDDHAGFAKNLAKMLRDFSVSWKDMSSSIKEHEVNSRLNKCMMRANDELTEIMSSMNQIANDISLQANDYSRLSRSIQDEVSQLRLVPVNIFLGLLPRYVRELANELNKKVDLQIIGADIYIDKYVLEGLKDPLNHLLRNAIDHGLESTEDRLKTGKSSEGKLTLTVKDAGNKIYFEISDDGHGLDYDRIKKKLVTINPELADKVDMLTIEELQNSIFLPGFSTKSDVSSISGRGVGLDVVRKNVQALKGWVTINSDAGNGCSFIICVPLTISSERGVVVRCDDDMFVLRTTNINRVILVQKKDIVNLEGGNAILIDGHPVLLKSLSNVLNTNQMSILTDIFPVVVLTSGKNMIALAVDQILGEREIVIKSIHEPLNSIACISGATLLDRNRVAIVLDPDELIALTLHTKSEYLVTTIENTKKTESLKILVVDDSITTRTLEKNILESKHYNVTTAVNGQEAWDILQKQSFSLVITDVNMPIMDGFELTQKIKSHDTLSSTPVIIVTSLDSASEKSRGVEVGADAYIVKNEFESGNLLQIITQLI